MKHEEELASLIYRRILGTITPEEAEVLDEWRKACTANETTYRKLMDETFLEREYRRIKAVDASRPLADMQSRIGAQRGRKRMLSWYRIGAAAAVAGLILWGVSYFISQPAIPLTEQQTTEMYASHIRPGETKAVLTLDDGTTVSLGADKRKNEQVIGQKQTKRKSEQQKLNQLTTPRGGEFRITLADGTEVWLNAESQLSYPDTFRTDERRVILKGEAYFQVAKNEQKPFYVESDGQLIRVYGTEFNIRSYLEDEEIYTTLVEGSVALQAHNGANAELFLTPGHQAVFDKQTASVYIRPVDTGVVTSWRKGMFVFEEQNLGQIMAELSRWYDFDYEFMDNVLSETIFMGSVPRYGDFNEVLEILEKSGGLKFRMQERTVIVSAH